MSFTFDASESGARPVYVVSVATNSCINVYGQSPCSAQVGVTGDQKCFNTRATCQDPAAFNGSNNFFFTFIEPVTPTPQLINRQVGGAGPFPFLSGPPSFSSSEVDPGGGFGIRASVSITLTDAPHHDVGVDLYVNERAYDPAETGTFWGKWLARNPFYIGQRVLVSLAHIDDDNTVNMANAQSLWYFVESIDGPDSSGRVTIKAKDVLKLAENVRAQCPRPSEGQLIAELEEGETTFFVGPEDALADYPAAGQIFKVRIGDEIIRCTRSDDQFTSVTEDGVPATLGRAIDNTTQSSHKEDSTVQIVKEFESQTVPSILNELLTDFASVPSSFIDLVQWNDTQADIGFLFSAQISEPEGVQELCEQLLKASGSFVYYDERDLKIKLGSITPTPDINTLPVLNDRQSFIADSVKITRKDDLRLSQVWYFRGLIDSTDDLDDPVNYENRLISADIEAETSSLYGQKKVDKVYARWTPRINAAAAFAVAGRRLNRFRRTPRMLTFQLDTKDADLWANNLVAVSHRNLQGPTGENQLTPFQILKVSHTGHHRLSYTALEYDVDPVGEFDGLDTIIIDQDTTAANILNIYESTIGPAENAGEIVTVLVLDGVAVRGMDGGGFPSSSIRLINRGVIAGLAGRGGNGGTAIAESGAQSAINGAAGEDGGDAINMGEDWTIFNYGFIYGGAGGGGGGGAAVTTSFPFNAAGGGGGGSGRDAILQPGGDGGTAIADSIADDGSAGGDGDPDGAGSGGTGGSVGGLTGGTGGTGGDWATAGSVGGSGSGGDTNAAGGAAGAAGLAIKQNGYSLTVAPESTGTVTGVIEP